MYNIISDANKISKQTNVRKVTVTQSGRLLWVAPFFAMSKDDTTKCEKLIPLKHVSSRISVSEWMLEE